MRHLDEGTIHAWLDDQLPPPDAEEARVHAAGCAECAARVAEARGFIAASSRILSALDEVPADVLPVRAPGAGDVIRIRAERAAAQRGAGAHSWWRHPGVAAAAALVVVALGSYRVLTRLPAADVGRQVAPAFPSAEPNEPAPSALARVAPPATTTSAIRPPSQRAEMPNDAAAAPVVDSARRRQDSRDAGQPGTVTMGSAARATVGADSQATPPASPDLARRVAALDNVVAPGGTAPATAPRPAPPAQENKERASDTRRLAAEAGRTLGARAVEREETLAPVAAKADAVVATAPGCYTLQWERTGSGPMAIAIPRFPTRIQLDTTAMSGKGEAREFAAVDLSDDVESRVKAELRWRVAPGGFDLLVERDGTTARLPVMLVRNPSIERDRALTQPAGAAVLLRATAAACHR